MIHLFLLLFSGVYPAEYISNYDGDTFLFVVDVPLAPPPEWSLRTASFTEMVRLLGADTPELRGRCPQERILAERARDAARGKILASQGVSLATAGRGKYGRLLADVILDGESLADWLVSEDLAVGYDGGPRKNWCEDNEPD